ncbi:MAG: hypothetical protein ACK5YR_13090 [Pirellula sp.]|jgi:hypothetical protein
MTAFTTTQIASFSAAAPKIAKPSGSSAGILVKTCPVQDNDVESRSDLFARILSRQLPLDESVYHAFKNPISTELSDDAFLDIVPLLSEIINPPFLDQITGANKRFELHAKFLRGLAFCLSHLRLQSESSRPTIIDSLMLYSLMPIYLASTRDKIVPAVESTLNKLRHSVCVVGWLKVMDSDAGYLWLEEQFNSGLLLESAIEQNLQISIPRITSQYWSDNQCMSQVGETDKGLWELACQLIRGDSQIQIPNAMSLGVVSWEKIPQHFNSLKQALDSIEHCHSNCSAEIIGPVEGCCSETTLPDAIKSASTKVENNSVDQKDKASMPPAFTVPVSKDRRLVEIRSCSDPQLRKVLDQLLQMSREEQTMLTIVVVSRLCVETEKTGNWFSPMVDQISEESEAEDLKGFVTDAGELALMFFDVDRSDVAYWLRESFSKLQSRGASSSIHSEASEQFIAGVAMVNAPSRSFELDQLIEAAWRCRDGAAIQGANAVKTIEVY